MGMEDAGKSGHGVTDRRWSYSLGGHVISNLWKIQYVTVYDDDDDDDDDDDGGADDDDDAGDGCLLNMAVVMIMDLKLRSIPKG